MREDEPAEVTEEIKPGEVTPDNEAEVVIQENRKPEQAVDGSDTEVPFDVKVVYETETGEATGSSRQENSFPDVLREFLLESFSGLDQRIDQRFSQTASSIAGLADQLSFIPKQIRNIAANIDDVSTAIADSNYRSLLLSVVSIYDLSEQMLRTLGGGDETEGHRCLATLTLQLRQIIETNGLVRIGTEGMFDPKLHRAIDSFDCTDAEKNDTIKEEIRPGFLDGSKVLRFAEVTVWKFAGNAGEPHSVNTAVKGIDGGESGLV